MIRSLRSIAAISALALSAATPGCGLLGADRELTPPPTDGIASFADAAPIELCVGTARVVAPAAASGASAVCLAEGAVARTCSADDGCDGIERCICGRCIVETCDGAASCGQGQACRNKRCTIACTTDAECASGERCISGGCARSCGNDGACHHGERCDALNEVCVAKTCSAQIPCGPGDACEPEAVIGELHEPEVVVIDGAPFAFVELRAPGAKSASIFRARIDSDLRWTADPADPVLAPEGDGRVGAPSAMVDGSTIDLWFTIGDGEAIGHAVSNDGGLSFERDPAPLLAPAEAWEKGWIGSPSAVRWDGATYLFYEAGPRAGVGLARVDAGAAIRLGKDPIVTTAIVQDPVFWRGVTEVGAPFALVTDGGLRVYFTARGVEGSDAIVADAAVPADPNDSIGLVTTFDGKRFDRYPNGPVLARIANLRAYLGEREASVRILPEGGAEITFVAGDASGAASGLARAR